MIRSFIKLIFAASAFLLLAPGAPAQTKLDEFAYTNAEISMARIDNFLAALHNAPSSQGCIIIYGPRSPKKGEVIAHIQQMPIYFKFRRFDASRITLVDGGYRDSNAVTVTLWIVAPDAPRPVPEDTLDNKQVKFQKGVFRRKSLYWCC
jgi:hypothetical protein